MSESTTDAIRITSKGEWIGSPDGDVQAKLSLGVSPRGHHYALEIASYNSESEDAPWSKAYATREQAATAGQTHRSSVLGDAPSPAEERAWQKESAAFIEASQSTRNQQTAYWGNVAATAKPAAEAQGSKDATSASERQSSKSGLGM